LGIIAFTSGFARTKSFHAGTRQALAPGLSPEHSKSWAASHLSVPLTQKQIADGDDPKFEKLLSAYSRIANILPRFGVSSQTSQPTPRFHLAISNIYADLLEFHLETYRLFRRRGTPSSICLREKLTDLRYRMAKTFRCVLERFWTPIQRHPAKNRKE
jgi:hypothetical protein